MTKSANPLAYSLRPYNSPRDLTISAWLPCEECQDVGKLKINVIGNNPGLIEQGFTKMGWEANVHKPKLCICPKCILKKKKERELLKSQPQIKSERILPTVRMPAVTPATLPVVLSRGASNQVIASLRDLTKEQRQLLRDEIETHFNEDAGRWSEGHSDHNASETLGIPRAVVIEFRESFYGPLKEDADVTWLRQEIAVVKGVIAGAQARMAKMEERLTLVQKKVGL